MVNHGATGAILATSGEFTRAAVEAAQKLGHVQLVDGDDLRLMLGPIREPAPAFDAVRMGVADGVPAAIARRVGERLLSAAEDRIRHGGSGRGRRAVSRSFVALLGLKLLAGVLFLGFVLLVWKFIVQYIQTTLAPVPPSGVVAPVPAPQRASAASAPSPMPEHGPCRGIIDAKSRSYVDHCMPSSVQRRARATEREQQRRAEEAMKVIADSTPEL